MEIIHNSHDSLYREPFGAIEVTGKVKLNIAAPEAKTVSVRFWKENEGEEISAMTGKDGVFSYTLQAPEKPCVIWYYFIINYPDDGCSDLSSFKTVYYGNQPDGFGGEGCIYEDGQPESFQITVYKKAPVPEWFKNSVVYQIFPDRFSRSSDFDVSLANALLDIRGGVSRAIEEDWSEIPINETDENGDIVRWKFYGGSLKGIREKLDYLKDLGVTAIYLNPIFRARSNHRYDTSDYLAIDPLLGDEKDFRMLADAAKSHGIRLILDGVFNHCGADSIYFDYYDQFFNETILNHSLSGCDSAECVQPKTAYIKGAYNHKDSPYRNWFTFKNEEPGYRCWWGIKDLPDFNTTNPEFIEFITGNTCNNNLYSDNSITNNTSDICKTFTSKKGVLKKWLRLGASGWRLDVADELPNAFLKEIRKSIKEENPDNVVIGEVWDDPSCKYNYGVQMEYFWGEELDSTMNYPFRAAVLPFIIGDISAHDFVRRFMSIAEKYPPENFYGSLNLLGSHDRERVMNILGGYPIARYGFDRETEYKDLSPEQYDMARKRLKMLSILQFLLPGVPDIYYGDEAGLQGGSDPDCRRTYPWGSEDMDLVNHFKWLGQFYHKHQCLKDGEFSLKALNDDMIALERWNSSEKILLIINRTDQFTHVEYKGENIELWPFDGKIIL